MALDACLAGSALFTADPSAIAAARALLRADPAVEITLVAPADTDFDPARLRMATSVLTDPADVRGSRLSSVRVATTEVRDGRADIWVAGGAPAPAEAAARFSFGAVQGATTPAVAWVVATETSPLVLVAGAGPEAPLLGAAVARTLLQSAAPSAGPLVDAGALVSGGGVSVLCTTRVTALAALQVLVATGRSTPPALLLGLTGLTVFDPVGGADPAAMLDLAVRAVRGGLGTASAAALGELVRQRRDAAGLDNGADLTP